MALNQANHDPTLSQQVPHAIDASSSAPTQPLATDVDASVVATAEALAQQMGGYNQAAQAQMANFLRTLPPMLLKLTDQGNLKEDAAQALSNLAQAAGFPHGQHQIPSTAHQLPVSQHGYPQVPHHHPVHLQQNVPGISDPGPSSHPRGPPNLGQLSAVVASVAEAAGLSQPPPVPIGQSVGQEQDEVPADVLDESDSQQQQGGAAPSASGGRSRSARSATMGTDEWTRQRKDNHKEVERRRRGNINEGINELGRIVPNSSGEKAKGAILSRAVQYIHHLKENEARNIEKWTLEKLLMDQAMGDLQAQLEEMRRLWEEERTARQRAESELDVLRGLQQQQQLQNHITKVPPPPPNAVAPAVRSEQSPENGSSKRAAENDMCVDPDGKADTGVAEQQEDGDNRSGKRPRLE